jgi:hypothetical protein
MITELEAVRIAGLKTFTTATPLNTKHPSNIASRERWPTLLCRRKDVVSLGKERQFGVDSKGVIGICFS